MPINAERHGLPRLAMGIGLRPLPILRVARDMNVAPGQRVHGATWADWLSG
jgi:hypothetical protein